METGSYASPECGVLSMAPSLSLASSPCFKCYLPSCFYLKVYFEELLLVGLVARYYMQDRRPALESNRYAFLMTTRGCDAGLTGCFKRVVEQSFVVS
jgi:hypothetical protein